MARPKRASRGGLLGSLRDLAWLFVVGCVAVALFKGAAQDPAGFVADLRQRATAIQATYQEWVTKAKIPQGGAAPGDPATPPAADSGPGAGASPAAASDALNALSVAPAQRVAYDRDEWRHWDNVSACWTVREAVLLRDAQPGSATLRDKDKRVTDDPSRACFITGGTWVDPYTGQTFTNPEDLDIDHLVPLAEAARSGGQSWSSDKKRDYANDLTDPTHLLAVAASANRAKADQTPATWRPALESSWCSYATSWTTVKSLWHLSVTTKEKSALQDMLARC